MKKLILVVFLLFTGMFIVSHLIEEVEASEVSNEHIECDRPNPDYYGDNALSNELDDNKTTLFYMYSNEDGHWFIDSLSYEENVIYVGWDELEFDVDSLHHGQRFVGTFADDTLWELIELEKVDFE